MDYRFKIDVSHLVEKVKNHNLLFYPVMIHIVVSVLNQQRTPEEEPFCAAYNLQNSGGKDVILWNRSDNCFPRFFEQYVKKCYRHIVGNEELDEIPENSVLVSCLPPDEEKKLKTSAPEVYLSAFETDNNRTVLPVLLKAEDDISLENFSKSCQKMCDMFNDWI